MNETKQEGKTCEPVTVINRQKNIPTNLKSHRTNIIEAKTKINVLKTTRPASKKVKSQQV